MVIAGVVIDKKDEKELRVFGVKDSKKLSPKRREDLAKLIEKIAKSIVVIRVQPCKIDNYRRQGINLDRIEAMKMAEIISMTEANNTIIDSLTHNPKKFESVIVGYLENKDAQLQVENYADETYPIVSAASIIAKVERDRIIEEIKRKENYDFGVGYSHDQRTIEFVEQLIRSKKPLPPFVRQTWVTTQVLKENSWQRKLKDFFKKGEKCKEEEK